MTVILFGVNSIIEKKGSGINLPNLFFTGAIGLIRHLPNLSVHQKTNILSKGKVTGCLLMIIE